MNTIRWVFLNEDQHRLRTGWRLLAFGVVFLIISRAITTLAFAVLGRPGRETLEWWLLRGGIVVTAVTMAVWISRRWIDRRPLSALGLRWSRTAWMDVGVGIGISLVMAATVVGVLAVPGWVDVEVTAGDGGLGPSLVRLIPWLLAVGAAVAWSEELALRGYLLQNLEQGIGLVWAVVVSCALYGLLHMSNPNATVLSGVLIAALGYLRVLGWLRTGQLWLSMGMHAGWNFAQGPLLGVSVSGMGTEGVLRTTLSGPAWLSGGSFGPEAGVAVIPALLVGMACMHLWTRDRTDTPWEAASSAAPRPSSLRAGAIPT